MILPESPKALAGDGALITWAGYVATHFVAPSILWALTVAVLLFRALILYRQWRGGQ